MSPHFYINRFPVYILQVVLAKEAGLCYASMGLVTDYDSWREDTESVG